MSNFTKIDKPTKEGEESKCIHCNIQLIGRLTDYKGRFPDYLQWQSPTERKAHYLKDGGCKEATPNTSSNVPEATAQPLKLEILDEGTQKLVKNEALFMVHIKSLVEQQVKEYTVNPHPGMIWEMTSLIWSKYFGGLEK